MKIVIINHTFQIPRFYKRWMLLAKKQRDWDITLIAPQEYKWDISGSMIFGNDTILSGEGVDNENFHIIPVQIKHNGIIGWTSNQMVNEILKIQPHIIYHIGAHNQPSLFQCLRLKKQLKDTKVIAFSMRGPTMDLHLPTMARSGSLKGYLIRLISYPLRKLSLYYFNSNCDAVLCHYPDALKCFQNEGFKKPIYISTQVGVDTDVFFPNNNYRNEIREKYNLGCSFVFGCAARFIPDKGLIDIIDALPKDGDWKCLLMGKGSDDFTCALNKRITERGLANKVILTGYVDAENMPKYWNAIDCAIHVPLTTLHWQETFSLAIVQAMACGKAVVGNTSGSVPYQVGKDGIIVPEGNIEELSSRLKWAISNPDIIREIGSKELKRVASSFSILHLNNHFIKIINDLMSGTYSNNLIDMSTFSEE